MIAESVRVKSVAFAGYAAMRAQDSVAAHRVLFISILPRASWFRTTFPNTGKTNLPVASTSNDSGIAREKRMFAPRRLSSNRIVTNLLGGEIEFQFELPTLASKCAC